MEIALNMKHVGDTLMEMKGTQDELVELLKTVAVQNARLDHLEDHSEKIFQDVQNLYNRMRDVELTVASGGISRLRDSVDALAEKVESALSRIGKLNTFLRWTTSRYAQIAYGALLVMLIISVLVTA